MSDVIEIRDLVKRYAGASRPRRQRRPGVGEGGNFEPPRERELALDGLDLTVHQGEVFGFLGPNGAGKTTTIRLLLDLIRPTSGSVRVFGVEPQVAGPELRRRVGYLPGEVGFEPRQAARALLTHLGALRGRVPARRIEALAKRLDLDLDVSIGRLSKGNRQKVGITQAFMHEPELLILDEPTSGLDPLFQREFLDLVREASRRGATVFMSSHVLSEVQQASDRTGIIRDGRMVAVEEVETLRRRAVRAIEVIFAHEVDASAFAGVDGLQDVAVDGKVLRGRLSGPADAWVKALARHEVVSVLAAEPDLEQLFFTYYARERDVDDTAEAVRHAA